MLPLALALPLLLAAPDFAGPIGSPKLAPAEGKRPVLAVLWDPKRPDAPAPPAEAIDELLFGPRPSVRDWFAENSGGKLALERAGCLGWYPADKPADHYWGESETEDKDGDGWLSGHAEKWAEAIRKADREFDFARFDADKDGRLAPTELAILVVIPQAGPFGTVRALVGRQAPKVEPFVVDGVRIEEVSEWYSGLPANFGAPAHELSHLILGAPDMYQVGHWPFAACGYSLMDASYGSAHLDPFLKLKLGWLDWTAVAADASGATEHALRDVETSRRALVVHDPKRGTGEYFLIENRWRGKSYDAGLPGGPGGIAADGLAVWHIVEDPALLARAGAPGAGADDWGRQGVRLLRANAGNPIDDRLALFDKAGAAIGDDTEPARLRWLDGSKAGIEVRLLTAPGAEVRVRVSVRR